MREELNILASLAKQENKEIYIVGGFVRDALRGVESGDVDMVVSEEVEQFAKRAAWRLRGEYELLDSHSQYSRIYLNGRDGKPFSFDISMLQGAEIEDDLRRRDFTVNAMAVKLADFLSAESWATKIKDPCGGMKDLSEKVLRLTSVQCLADDPVRLFRAARFSLKLAISVAPETRTALRENAGLIRNAQKMKLALEFFQLLSQPYAAEGLRLLHNEFNVLAPFFPPLYRMSAMADGEGNVLEHGLQTCLFLENILKNLPQMGGETENKLLNHLREPLWENRQRITYLRLACLLHDVGKVDSQPCGRPLAPSFNHEIAAEAYISSLAKRLCLNEDEEYYLIRLICNHSRPEYLFSNGPGSRLRYFRQFGETAPELILLAMSNAAARSGFQAAEKMAQFLSLYFEGAYDSLPQPLLTSHDIMKFFNLPPVRTVGGLLEDVYAAQLDGTVTSKNDALALASKLLDERDNG